MDKVWIERNSMTLLVRVNSGTSFNGHNSMNLVVRVHGGTSSDGRNPINLVARVHSGASCKDVIPRRFRGGASRPGCSSTKASWWCLM
ncbi:hypothetical protein DEO72_LG6g840 [Vigna unguiculata]|uniref:Uncharacterized protein n=1 Tax=Vigna unguiculata TaxID=3917 RepID=A0A4D6M6I6_VIGUN|nr:hypothetical protein DEO72_LG6g840 [Vigna unguiculata]